MKYRFILNGRKELEDMRKDIFAQLETIKKNSAITYDIETYVTTGMGDATRFVYVYCDLHPNEEVCFVACGGNGTVNEVASGIVGFKNKSLGVLAYGLCNDFSHYYSEHSFKDVAALLKGTPTPIDIMKVNDNYFINVCNIGFNSVVCSSAIRMEDAKIIKPYYLGIIYAILTARFNNISVYVDGEKIGGRKLLTCELSNGKFIGGEFTCAPKARMDDGLIDVTFVKPMFLSTFVKALSLYSTGSFLEHPKYSRKFIYRQVRRVEVKAKRLIELCLDGEMLPGKNFVIEVLPKAITLILPSK